jgi:hypothetical protein
LGLFSFLVFLGEGKGPGSSSQLISPSPWVTPAPIPPRSPPPLFQVLAKPNQDSPLPLASSDKPMSTDEFGGIFNYSPSETSTKKGREEFYNNDFIRETTFASREKVSYNDRPLPIIDTTDMSDSQEMPDSQSSQLSLPSAQPPNFETCQERILTVIYRSN